MKTPLWFERQNAAFEWADKFIRAAKTNDDKLLFASMEGLQSRRGSGGWQRVLKKGRKCSIHPGFPTSFLSFWEEHGALARESVNDDIVLIDLLHIFLPPYTGRSVELFRGETALNRRKQTYGMSWSADRKAAAFFATQDERCCHPGGSVLLRTVAPASAILGAPHVLGARYSAEAEYIVDRRRLSGVTVLERFPEKPLDAISRAAPHSE